MANCVKAGVHMRRPARSITRSVAFLATLACLYATSAWGMPRLALTMTQASRVIAQAYHRPVNVVELFPGPDGLVGAVVAGRSGDREIVWLLPHGDALFAMGALRDADGNDLARAAMKDQGIVLSPAAVMTYARDPAHHGILVGHGGPLVTVLLDTDSSDCHQLYLALAQEAAHGRVRVRFLLVGGPTASSTLRAAAILAADDPAAALAANEKNFDTARNQGGFPIATASASAYVHIVEGNDELFAQAGGTRTPATYYCSRATRKALVMFGMPRDLQAFLMQADPSGLGCGE